VALLCEPQCSLWLAFEFDLFSGKNLTTEDTEVHRGTPQSKAHSLEALSPGECESQELASASPFQRYWPAHRMFHLFTGSLRLQVRRFQSEVPLGGTIGVVDQHQMRVVLQAFCL